MSPPETETTGLLRRWHGGEQEALHELLERHLPAIRGYLHRKLGPLLRRKETTSDFVQDTAMEILVHGPRFRVSDPGHFRALLYRSIENVLRDRHDWYTTRRRDLARERPLPSDLVLELDRPHSPEESADRRERVALARLGLELLDPARREAILLRTHDGLTFGEMGKRLGISEEAARKRCQRSLIRLSRIVGSLRRGRLAEVVPP